MGNLIFNLERMVFLSGESQAAKSATALLKSVAKPNRPAFTLAATRSSSPGS